MTQRTKVCSHCGLPHHHVDRCFYKHPHLKRPDWQSNTVVLQRIKSLHHGSNANTSRAISVDPPDVPDGAFDIFSCNYIEYAQATWQLQSNVASSVWIVDSHASHHFCNSRSVFSTYTNDPMDINTGNGSIMSPRYGTVHL